MALNTLTSFSLLLLLFIAPTPSIQADSSGLLPGASANQLQYITYIDKASGGSNPEYVYGTQKTQNYLYTFAEAVAALGTGTIYSQYNASGEASIDRFMPDSNSSVLPYPLISVNASPAPQGYTVAFAKANASTPGLRNFTSSDPLIGGICQVLSAAFSTVESQKGALQKVTAVGEGWNRYRWEGVRDVFCCGELGHADCEDIEPGLYAVDGGSGQLEQ